MLLDNSFLKSKTICLNRWLIYVGRAGAREPLGREEPEERCLFPARWEIHCSPGNDKQVPTQLRGSLSFAARPPGPCSQPTRSSRVWQSALPLLPGPLLPSLSEHDLFAFTWTLIPPISLTSSDASLSFWAHQASFYPLAFDFIVPL